MGELEPNMHINFNGSEFDLGREHATLFTFLGRAALNHVFIHSLESQGEQRNGYIFAGLRETQDAYNTMANYMTENEYPMVLNQLEVPSPDMEAYLRAATRDIEQRPDWLDGEAA